MDAKNERHNKGFSLVELMIASAVAMVVLGSVMTLVNQALKGNSNITARSQLQQNAQVALNLVAQDLSIAGTGMPKGGIPLPSGPQSNQSKRGCNGSGCGVWNLTSDYGTDNVNNRLYSALCGNGLGPDLGAGVTDIVTVAYVDTTVDLGNNLSAIASNGSSITVLMGASSLKQNDILKICDGSTCAAAVVTANPTGSVITLADGDGLSFNQSNATQGSVKGLYPSGPASIYAEKLVVVTYYIESSTMRLMRQVNLNTPVPVGEIIENLQFTYDIQGATSVTSNLDDAGTTQNQIRKINIRVVARSLKPELDGHYDRMELTTSVSVRNMAFVDRFPTS